MVVAHLTFVYDDRRAFWSPCLSSTDRRVRLYAAIILHGCAGISDRIIIVIVWVTGVALVLRIEDLLLTLVLRTL